MGYINRSPHGLGGITDVLTAGRNVLEDPCLGSVAKLVNDLHNLEQKKAKTLAGLGATAAVPGIVLCAAVTPLKIAVYVKRNKWVLPIGGIAVFGVLVGLGYALGRSERRR